MAEFYNISNLVNHSAILDNETTFDNCFTPKEIETVHSIVGKSFLVIVYSLASLAALLGNSAVIVVELYGSESAANIRKYLINLAVADIILGVFCVPLTYSNFMLGQWILPNFLCPITQYVQLLSVFVTSITLSLIGVERYLAILHPFSHVHQWLESHTNVVLTILWTLGAFYSAIPLKTPYIQEDNASTNLTTFHCTYSKDISLLRRRLFVSINFVLTFLLPFVVLVCAYSGIMKKLINDQQEAQLDLDANNDNRNSQSENTFHLRRSFLLNDQSRIIKMLFIIILLFVICWLPIKLYQSLFDFHLFEFCTENEFYAMIWLYFACHWTAMASSFVNPIVYSFMSKSFRKDLKNITNSFQNNNDRSSIRTISFQA